MDFCFKAYPASSVKRWKDPDNKCRTVTDFVRDIDGPWSWNKRDYRRTDRGLCKAYETSMPDMSCA